MPGLERSGPDPRISRRDAVSGVVHLALWIAGSAALGGCTALGRKLQCNEPSDLRGLSDFEKSERQRLGYIERSPDVSQRCDNCSVFRAGLLGANSCGECTLLKGPVNPAGYCSAWVAKL
ncbi:MAG TPA: high-potential iron-sulfur protein [Polyangiales bacterium]|nr:high-potential iron-sulfur protein [Polyangiales bacterium]